MKVENNLTVTVVTGNYRLKMHPEKYTLTWHSHSDYLREMMREMMTSDDFTDVTLVTDDKKTIKAHA